MATIVQSFVVLALMAFTSSASAGAWQPVPDAGADVLHQQDTIQLEEEEEEEDEEEEDEPDCE